jgi:hypothetical protein
MDLLQFDPSQLVMFLEELLEAPHIPVTAMSSLREKYSIISCNADVSIHGGKEADPRLMYS